MCSRFWLRPAFELIARARFSGGSVREQRRADLPAVGPEVGDGGREDGRALDAGDFGVGDEEPGAGLGRGCRP